MKKLLILLLFAYSFKGFGQTYFFYLSYSVPTQKYCWDGQYGWQIFGNGKVYKEQIKSKTHLVEYTEYDEYFSVPNFQNFGLTIKSTCLSKTGVSSCSGDQSKTISAATFIKNGTATLFSCEDERFAIDGFKPNVTISNASTTPSELCAGEQLSLAAYPPGFPAEAYHWQYSLDNAVTWIDVPLNLNGKQVNEKEILDISMQELIGANHTDYINKQVLFRLGYSQNRPFTDPLTINYKPCAPVLEYFVYVGPKCYDDNIQSLDVYFDRQLRTGEQIQIIYAKNANPAIGGIFLQNKVPITKFVYDDKEQKFKYSFTELGKLENKNFFNIEYQASENGIPKGYLVSTQDPFQYVNPQKLSFTISDQKDPTCVGGNDGFIEITITSGTPPFYFYKNEQKVTPEYSNGKYYIRNLNKNNYNILVTDKSGCIDKDAND
ncbi:MAG: SprB repeat-containing protein [Flavobacterium nitrogenifigens]|uniref:SprB repeat-containing protein n=1 Tax=Flavobacterium nitrogenifigens TaxID=1617283 RepID=UPI002806C04C|nr:SprB repeat-containing protein [Flavobacterium nitrogenifigens]MDQ8013083.1 SprB repeat-containing protein [Flavobacterium nitrogenifigens]